MNARLLDRIEQDARRFACETYGEPTEAQISIMLNAFLRGAGLAIKYDSQGGDIDLPCESHTMEQVRVEDRRPSNWCAACHGWFTPVKKL